MPWSRSWQHWLIPPAFALAALARLGGLRACFCPRCDGGSDDPVVREGKGTAGGGLAEVAVPPRGSDMGKIEVKAPDRGKLVETTTWGEVPANQICVMLVDGKTRADAAAIAQTLGGTVVGELEYLNLYQIETNGTNEDDLRSCLDQATALEGVESAFPNLQMISDQSV